MKALLLAIAITGSFSAFAQDCSDPTSTYEIKICASQSLEKDDKRLNTQYALLVKKLDKVGVEKLKKAQRAWIAFRDAECDLQADEMRGGSGEGMIAVSCLATMTKERADSIQDLVEFR